MIKKYPVITHVFDIPQRLKEIDPGYFVLYNTQTGKYEVHHNDQPDGSLCVILPYDELDERAVFHVRRTLIANIEKLLEEMDQNNRKTENESLKKNIERANEKARQTFNYVRHKEGVDDIDNKAFTTRFI